MRSIVFSLGLVFASVAATSGPASADGFVPGQVIVRYRSPRALPRQVSTTSFAARSVSALTEDTHVVEMAGAADDETLQLVAELQADPDVLYAQPNFLRHKVDLPALQPQDPDYSMQWGLQGFTDAETAWGARYQGSASVVVGVLDTGYRPHPELMNRLVPGYDFVSGKNSGDGDGPDADPTDPPGRPLEQYHGTHVAGIIGAVANDHLGTAGLDWNCRIQPVRVLGIDGQGADSDIANAIRWASGIDVAGFPHNNHPVAVINMSFGGPRMNQFDTGYVLQDAINDAHGRNVILVAAAGNNDSKDVAGNTQKLPSDPGNADINFPASLNGVISVGAVTINKLRADYSNRGYTVAIMAPGGGNFDAPDTEKILSTLGDADYGYLSGTSQAAPFVTATAALMRSVNPNLTADDAKKLMMRAANPNVGAQCFNPYDPNSTNNTGGCGAGLLDVYLSVFLAASVQGLLGGPVVSSGYGSCSSVAGDGTSGLAMALLGLVLLVGVRIARKT